LIIIGGHERKNGDKPILAEVARRIGNGRLVVTTVASEEPDGLYDNYERVFRSLGVKHLANLEVRDREQATAESTVRVLADATGVFFTGGDQLRITSQIGDTPTFQRIREIYEEGGVLAGTSAGASVMCETMLVAGNGDRSHRLGEDLQMAPGLGFIEGMVIDQHFAERGRVGRLLAPITQNPKNLGIGIDEDTALVVENEKSFYVLGSGAVYVFDGQHVTASNVAEAEADHVLSVYDMTLHVLSQGDRFDLYLRQPSKVSRHKAEDLEALAEVAGRGS